MSKFLFHETPVLGMYVVETSVFGDERGYFSETYNKAEFAAAGIGAEFVQDNQSKSKKGVLRGLHFQKQSPQGKLVRTVSGEVFDVGVDLRPGSKTFCRWFGTVLSAQNKLQLYIPEGFAHGFLVLSDEAEFVYKCTRFYNPDDEGGLLWNDPDLAIDWPVPPGVKIVLSDKDKKQPSLKEYLASAGR